MLPTHPLTTETARKLATTVAKESTGVSVKIGETNGLPVLHLIHRDLRTSVNITSEADWAEHPWNKYNRPKETLIQDAN